ncbi:hypothetical protein [Roseococcus sp. YIM B11640]|uniref:hypothetical protein n=1 Tax=Roseococcus sp. YIM B11640 TaxID=3133973 RepID=UPI003C7CEFB3
MEQFTQALWALAAAVVTAVGGVAVAALRDYATNLKERTANLVQQRLGEGAARVAGEISAKVAGDPAVTMATDAMMRAGADALRERFPDTAGRLPVETLEGMIRGELGKRGEAVAPSIPASAFGRLAGRA